MASRVQNETNAPQATNASQAPYQVSKCEEFCYILGSATGKGVAHKWFEAGLLRIYGNIRLQRVRIWRPGLAPGFMVRASDVFGGLLVESRRPGRQRHARFHHGRTAASLDAARVFQCRHAAASGPQAARGRGLARNRAD